MHPGAHTGLIVVGVGVGVNMGVEVGVGVGPDSTVVVLGFTAIGSSGLCTRKS